MGTEGNNKNPWIKIDPEDYEQHMSHSSVYQLQTLNNITKDQYSRYMPETLVIFGVCTGNGLEHISNEFTRETYGIDINNSFLEICRKRYSDKIKNLNLVCLDVNTSYFDKTKADLVIANLFIEYTGIDRFIEQINILKKKGTVVSVIIQKNNTNSFISDSGINTLGMLSVFHDEINDKELELKLKENNFIKLKKNNYDLPNGKQFIRIDYCHNV